MKKQLALSINRVVQKVKIQLLRFSLCGSHRNGKVFKWENYNRNPLLQSNCSYGGNKEGNYFLFLPKSNPASLKHCHDKFTTLLPAQWCLSETRNKCRTAKWKWQQSWPVCTITRQNGGWCQGGRFIALGVKHWENQDSVRRHLTLTCRPYCPVTFTRFNETRFYSLNVNVSLNDYFPPFLNILQFSILFLHFSNICQLFFFSGYHKLWCTVFNDYFCFHYNTGSFAIVPAIKA